MNTSPTDWKRSGLSCILIIIMMSSLFGQTSSQSGAPQALPFLEFGANVQTLPNDGVDTISEEIIISNGFPFGRTVQTSAFVGDNGVISFGRSFFLYDPQTFPGTVTIDVVAPYWSDNDITIEGSVRYEVLQSGSSSREDTMLATVSNFIKEIIDNGSAFQGTYMILAEWNGVHPYPQSSISSFSPDQQALLALANAYQAIVITNHEESYAIFTYNCGEVEWAAGLGSYSTIGFYSASDGIFENHPLTGQPNVNMIACDPNPDINNVIYAIGTVNQQQLRRECLEWFFSDLNIFDDPLIAVLDQAAQTCPCSFFQALFDPRFRFTFTPSKTSTCFVERFPISALATRECCYSNDPFTTGALVMDTENGGSLLLSPTSDDSLQQNNTIPQSLCCAAGLCDLYYRRRPQNFCEFYFPPFFVWAFGDPHITTLDGFTYTFNGIGEYVLARSVDDDIEFQGRTTLVENSGATAFSAFAIRHSGTTVQISFNGEFTVLVNANDESINLMTVGSNIQMSSYELERLASDSLELSFSSGITLTTNYTNGIFNFVLNLPPTLTGQTEGLLGSLNSNASDDCIFRNGTLLPNTSSDAEKHVFGQSWQINATESLFQYEQGQTVETLSVPDHIPPFLDNIRARLEGNSTLTDTCGSNTQCLFDFDQTGNEAVGMATMDFMQEVMEEVIMSESFPPNITAPDIFMATVRIDSIYSFNVTGSINVNVMINGQGTLPPNAAFTGSGNTFTLTWNPADITEEFNVTIIAIAERNASRMFVPRVQLCGCMNGGNCTEAGVLNLEAPFVILNCDCPAAYDGELCQNDVDGCEAISCLEGQACMDLPAPTAGAVCACPVGYLVINSKCVDIDECNLAHNCTELQNCANTPGSFECTCRPGYSDSLTSPLRCEDINECDEGLDGCHQICTNTNGSFECSCRQPEFVLQSDQLTCNASANSTCPASNVCEQMCFLDSVTMQPVCSCLPGYQLDSDNTNCSDINECETNNGGCSQNCNNTVGGFSCSCNSNFTLDIDKRTCNDIDECQGVQTIMFLCPNNLLCNNLIGGYECICPSGTMLDPEELLCEVIVTPSSSISPSTTSTTSSTVLITTTSSSISPSTTSTTSSTVLITTTSSTVLITTTSSSISPSTTSTTSSTVLITITSIPTATITPNVTAENPDSQSDGLSGGEIAAIVIGSVFGAALVLAIIAVTAFWINRRYKSKSVDLTPGPRTRGRGSLRTRHASSFVIARDE